MYSIYRDAFFNYRFGSAAAQSVVLFIIIMLITLVMFRIEKKGSELLMSQTDTMAVSPRNTISREELLALKKRMNAKALTRRRLRTGGLLAGNVVMALLSCCLCSMR